MRSTEKSRNNLGYIQSIIFTMILIIRQRINAARIRDQQEVNAHIEDNPDNLDRDGEEATGEQIDLQGLISFAINKTFTVNIRPKALKVLSCFISFRVQIKSKVYCPMRLAHV